MEILALKITCHCMFNHYTICYTYNFNRKKCWVRSNRSWKKNYTLSSRSKIFNIINSIIAIWIGIWAWYIIFSNAYMILRYVDPFGKSRLIPWPLAYKLVFRLQTKECLVRLHMGCFAPFLSRSEMFRTNIGEKNMIFLFL